MANDVRRQLSDIAYVSAGQVSTLDMPRDSVLRELGLMFTLSQTTGAAQGSGTLSEGGIWSAIRRIELSAEGALNLWSIDPVSLYYANALWNGAFAQRDVLASPGAASSNILQGYLEMPFALPFCANPNLTLLNAQALSSLTLRITWGSVSDLYQTIANTAINTTSILTPETHEIVGLGPRSVFSIFKVSQIARDITATQNRFEIELPRSNIIRGLLIKARNTTNSVEDLTDGLLNEVTLESSENNRGIFVHRRVRATDTNGTARQGYHIRNAARLLYGLADLNLQAAATGVGSLLGIYPFEFMEDRRVSSALRVQPFSSFKALCDVTNAGTTPQLITNVFEIIPAARPR